MRGAAGPRGVFAAPITPVDEAGEPDPERLAALLQLALDAGVDGVCIGGGTGEYPHFERAARRRIVEVTAEVLAGRAPWICAVGAPTLRATVELAAHAAEHGCAALLLPMPSFYRFAQQDLAELVRQAVSEVDHPWLLYNLPVFTNSLEPETSVELLRSIPALVGLKDSSGDRDALATHARARDGDRWSLLCGSDGLVLEALRAGWDGSISGIAGACPELLVALVAHHRAGRGEEAARCQRLLDELVTLVGGLPVPWAIRAAAAARGIDTGPLHHPASAARRAELDALEETFRRWFDHNVPLPAA